MIAITLQAFCNTIKEAFSDCSDICIRTVTDGGGNRFAFAYIDNLSDRGYISTSLIMPTLSKKDGGFCERVTNTEIKSCESAEAAIKEMLSGNAAVYSESEDRIYIAAARSEEFRGIENAGVEEVVRGPHDSFIEDAKTNVALIRRRIKNNRLKCIKLSSGKLSSTDIYIMYVDGIADNDTVEEVKKRIVTCDLETLHDSGTLEMAILDGRFSVFPLIGNTERPDKAAAKLSEGRVAIIVDGSPVVLTAPELYIETLQSADDYSKSPQYATFSRILRFVTVLVSLLLPSLYLAALEYHQTVIPKKLLETLAREREHIPYSIFAEVFVMLFVFDMIREVGQRMPRAMGSVVSIVAGIVLGDAAMTAGLVSAPTLMIIAISATSAYISPPVTWTNILLKYVFAICAQLGGFLGVFLAFAGMCAFLCAKTSFGVPYFSPVAPFVPEGIKDTLIKLKGGVQN